MNLVLWRHAEAEDGSPDLARALTARGQKQARVVGAWLNRQLPAEARILVSPALRTRQTADAIGREYQIVDAIAPGAGVDAVLQQIASTDPFATVVLVGHQPWIGETAAKLLTGRVDAWSVRKAAAWWLVQRDRNGQQWTLRNLVDPETF